MKRWPSVSAVSLLTKERMENRADNLPFASTTWPWFTAREGTLLKQLALEEQGLGILEKLLGENHPEVAAALNNIGSVEIDLGNYVDAMKHLQRSLAIKESVFGKQSPDVALALNNLADLFGILGDSENRVEP